MKLTKKEFEQIRPLMWYKQQFGYEVYNTTDTPQMFWFDFMKNVFAKYFKQQKAITQLSNIDVTQPVLMKNDLTLKLPLIMETVVYYAKNQQDLNVKCIINLSQKFILLFSLIIFVLLVFIKSYTKHSNAIKSIINSPII